MKLLLKILFLVISIVNIECGSVEPETVAPVGRIRGSILYSRLGRKIYSFRGVRYAEAPTGERRFQVATPVADWKGVFDASKEGPSCPSIQKTEPITEDCLRLNVYTTTLPSSGKNVTRPVLVFLHPGGYYSYSGQSSYFGPKLLLDKDIVLITLNYRLGSLGFISTGDSSAPGNLGLKDQVVALRWIQRNIAAFGGNPNSVTLSGYSVGGLSVMLHMLSPMSKNLFHRAIIMSGSLLTTELYPNDQKHLAKKQAEALDCPTECTQAMMNCLRSKPVENFTDTMFIHFDWHGDPIVNLQPVVESKFSGGEQFLLDQPVNLIRQRKFHQVPAIFGVTKDEFGGVVVAFEKRAGTTDDFYKEMDANWTRIAPISFMYERGTPRSENISTELRQFYFGDQPINSATRDGLAHIYADSIITFPMHRGTKLIAQYSDQPVYSYEFTFQGHYSFSMWNDTTPYGVVHHDDLQYLFFPFFDSTAPENPMVDLYISMWTSFVETGEPVPKTGPFANIKWDRYTPEKDNYLEVNLNPTMRAGLYVDRMREWERIFPLPPLPQ